MRYNKEQMWDNLIQIENMENMWNLDAAPSGVAAQNMAVQHLMCSTIPEVWMQA
jgi:hypothetical protein